MFVCGGKDGLPSACCERYIPQDLQWKFVAEMSEERVDLQIVSCRKLIWAIGGRNANETSNSTEYYDHLTDKWTKSTQMLEKRSGHSAVAFRDHIYVIGGIRSHPFAVVLTAEVLDTKTGQFTAIKPIKTSCCVFATAISEHKLYCFGSLRFDRVMLVESFNLYSGEWETEENLNKLDQGDFAITVYD